MLIFAPLLGLAVTLQVPQTPPQTVATDRDTRAHITQGAVPLPTDSGAVATLADSPPAIDGRDDDAVWRVAPPIDAFVEWQPTEGKAPRYRTEAKVAYDAANLYVFIRAFDAHPDSIIRILERRDTYTPSDMLWVFVDSYHDRRTGYEFGVNAAGVKMDLAVSEGGHEDDAWDAVWDVATTIDSLGWTAEFRIPLSQMRYARDRSHIFGFTINRDIYRYNERVSWPRFSQSKPDMVSQLGTLEGLHDLETPRRLEAIPYAVTRKYSTIEHNQFTNPLGIEVGGDLKYRVASNVTLDATVNPDFGQVEADPAVLNLSAYESFFDERRPFFVAGRGLFNFSVNCNQVNCGGEGLYYSRRIGRTPSLARTYDDTVSQPPTRILGAAKLTGRLPGGFNFGVLNATTQRFASPGDTTWEPATNFAAVRARQDLRNGNSSVGGMITAVNRRNDAYTSPFMPSDAYAAAVDFRHRFLGNAYELSGSLDRSRVQGSASAIADVQTSSVHYYQRPDANLPLDTTLTALEGDAEELKLGKIAGQNFMFETAYQRRSPGFEINDMGYLRRADQQSWSTWAGLFDRKVRRYTKRLQWNNNWWQYWTTDGLPIEMAYNTNAHITFLNNVGLHFGGTLGQLGTTYDDRGARGGPAVRNDPYIAPWLFLNGDDRQPVVPNVSINYVSGNGGRSHFLGLEPGVSLKLNGRFSSAFSFNVSKNTDDAQFYDVIRDGGGTHYTFAHLVQKTTSATIRLNYTFMPNVTLQAYLQPFVSKGTFSDVRQLSSTPRADRYEDRYASLADTSVTNHPGGFNFKQFASNLVFRWEYRPGSTLFVVWNEGRQGFAPEQGTADFQGDVRDLMRLHPANTLLVKMSYWLNR